MSVVIGLQSTGETALKQAAAEDDWEDDWEAFSSAPHMVLKNLIERHLPEALSGQDDPDWEREIDCIRAPHPMQIFLSPASMSSGASA